MAKILTKRNLFAVIGALIVGALGNGLWELVKPGLTWTSSGVLDLATFGLSSLRDGMYRDIAMGQHERASLSLLSYLSGFLCGLFLVAAAAILKRDHATKSAQKAADGGEGVEEEATLPIWIRRTVGLLAIGGAAFLLVNTFRITYVIRASAHMTQMVLIADPYLSEQQRLLVRADLAGIQGHKDYVVLETLLSDVALKNKRPVPSFNVY